nr:EamA family transporter RarD [Bacillus subtilis]
MFPLYWKLLEQLPALDILAHRIIWSFVFMCIVLFFLRQWKIGWQELRSLKKNGGILSLFLASILISINWFVYIWAVNHGFLLEASLGYYINPLVSVLLGILFLKEKLNRLQLVVRFDCGSRCHHLGVPIRLHSLCCASPCIQLWAVRVKQKKNKPAERHRFNAGNIHDYAHCIGVFTVQRTCSASGCRKRRDVAASLFTGVFTALPLLLFAEGAKRLPLYQVGILQYIAPTITLLIGLFVYHEPFSSSKAFTFSCIWAALLLFTFSQVKWKRASKSH